MANNYSKGRLYVKSSTGGTMLIKREHNRLYRMIGEERFVDVEHFRNPPAGRHVAVCVVRTKSGGLMGFIGVAQVGKRDTYNRKIGHTVAMGKAMRQAADYLNYEANPVKASFDVVPVFGEPVGRELREVCYQTLMAWNLLLPEVR